MSMRIKYRSNWFAITLTADSMTVTCERCKGVATKISFQGTVDELEPGETRTFALGKGGKKGGAD